MNTELTKKSTMKESAIKELERLLAEFEEKTKYFCEIWEEGKDKFNLRMQETRKGINIVSECIRNNLTLEDYLLSLDKEVSLDPEKIKEDIVYYEWLSRNDILDAEYFGENDLIQELKEKFEIYQFINNSLGFGKACIENNEVIVPCDRILSEEIFDKVKKYETEYGSVNGFSRGFTEMCGEFADIARLHLEKFDTYRACETDSKGNAFNSEYTEVFHKESKIAIELVNKLNEVYALCLVGASIDSVGIKEKAREWHKRHKELKKSKENRDV